MDTGRMEADGNLSLGLLFKIMKRMGELRANRSRVTMSQDLFDLADGAPSRELADYIDAHLEFLQGREYLVLGQALKGGGFKTRHVELTTEGNVFVQPELADFGQRPLLPEVAESIEKQFMVLTYPSDEKDGLLFSLRDAFAKKSSEIIAKVLVEICFKIASGGAS